MSKQIEHDPNEPPPDRSGNGVYWAAFALLCVMWALAFALDIIQLHSAALGFSTGMAFGIWSMAVTNGHLPPWWPR